jgi:hypothetical protein
MADTYYTFPYNADGTCCTTCNNPPSCALCSEGCCPSSSYTGKNMTVSVRKLFGVSPVPSVYQHTGTLAHAGGGAFSGNLTQQTMMDLSGNFVCGRQSYSNVGGTSSVSASITVSCSLVNNSPIYVLNIKIPSNSGGYTITFNPQYAGTTTSCTMVDPVPPDYVSYLTTRVTSAISASCYSFSLNTYAWNAFYQSGSPNNCAGTLQYCEPSNQIPPFSLVSHADTIINITIA